MIVSGAAVIVAGMAWSIGWGGGSRAERDLSPAQALALRFGSDAGNAGTNASAAQVAARQLQLTAASRLALSPNTMLRTELPDGIVTGRVPERTLVYAAPATTDGIGSPATARRGELAAGAGAPPLPPSRPIDRNAAFSDGQIASIKERLKLTAEQQRYWEPVESALRGLIWRHARDRSAKAATLDPAGVQKLTAAATALMTHLNAEQKKEVRALAFLVGLDKLAAQL